MNWIKKIEAKDNLPSQFSRFIVIGGISTIINYFIFFIVYTIFTPNYLIAATIGYIVGALFGYVLNVRVTFKSKTGLNIITYFLVYTFSLVMSLGVLKFFSVSFGFNPLVSNIIAIAFSTATNFLGIKYITFNKSLKLPPFFKSKIFLTILVIKIVSSFLFASDFMTKLFIPFVNYFVDNPLSNPYEHFSGLGIENAFPYTPLMLFIISVPSILFGAFGKNIFFDLFSIRLTLLLADLIIFYILYKLFRGKEKHTLIFYWASPIIFYINYIHGQLDIIPAMFLFSSVYFLITKRHFKSALLLGAGIATKTFVFVAIPIYLIYLINKRIHYSQIVKFFLITTLVYVTFISIYLFSDGFIKMVFFAGEQFRLFDLGIDFKTNLIYYIVPAAYAYILFKMISFKKITTDILFVSLGVILTILVTFISPARGWYLWSIPFISYFFIKRGKDLWIYMSFSVFYLLYFFFSIDSDIFNFFQLISPQFASHVTPYNYLNSIGLRADILSSLLFTALTSILLYIIYITYRNGIRSSLLFQKTTGTPIIGICGDSGTGKTTLAKSLVDLFGGNKITMIYGDDVHKWERKDDRWKKYTHLNPLGNKIYLNYKQIKQLKNGISINRSHYDHETGKFTKPITIKPKDFIISEGLHTFFINESNDIYELKIYMDPDPSLRLLWKLKRDMKERGYSKKDIIKQLKKRELDVKRFILPQKHYSDVILHYKSQKKINFAKIHDNIPIYVEVDIKNDIPTDELIDLLSETNSLKLNINYPDHKFQRLTISGHVNRGFIEKVLNSLDLDYESYEIDKNGIKDGIDGVIQIILLYCLNKRLKSVGGIEDYD